MRHPRKPINSWKIETSRQPIALHLKGAEMKLVIGVIACGGVGGRGLDQREDRVRELVQNGQVGRRNREPSEPKHVSARFSYVTDLLPTELGDPQSRFPSAHGHGSGERTRTPAIRPLVNRARLIRISNASSCIAKVANATFRLSSSRIRACST
jgi:hypothetical protein